MATAVRPLVSEAEFLALPESSDRIELVDGEVVVAPSPSFWHQELLTRVVEQLRRWAEGREVSVAQAPLDVRFGPGRILQPDAMVFLERLPAGTPTPVDRIPELCIEVLSTNRAYDRVTKRFLYAEAGVAELWLVEPDSLIERRFGDDLTQTEETTGELESPLLPDFRLDIATLFER